VTYRSHPVRRLCESPTADATVTLIVGTDGETEEADLRDRLPEGDGLEPLPYDSFRVTVPESVVADVCAVAGVTRVETANVIGTGDSGEDV
jgi:hypothetical protein